jgi:hypothetical protein
LALVVSLGQRAHGLAAGLREHLYDYWHQIAGKRRDAQHAAVIAVDDDTLLQYKDDPLAFWQPIFAQAMQNLTMPGSSRSGWTSSMPSAPRPGCASSTCRTARFRAITTRRSVVSWHRATRS